MHFEKKISGMETIDGNEIEMANRNKLINNINKR